MKSVEITTVCPFCNDVLPLATAAFGNYDEPQSGDFSICFTCGTPGIFDDVPGGVRKPNESEARDIARDPDLQGALWAWKKVRRG